MQKTLGLLVITALAGTAMGQAVNYSTPYTPGTPSGLQASWSGLLDGTSPVFRRAAQSSSETAPIAPTTLASAGNYPYSVQAFTPSVTGLYQFYSAQAYDGYMHLYENLFDPLNALTNVRAGDDDMGTLNGGAVPNRNGTPTTNDSGFQFNLNAGTTYHIVTSTFGASVPASGAFYNEIYGGGTSATPVYNIPDNNPAGVDITLIVPASETRSIVSFDSVALTNFTHSWMGDLIVTLTHVDTGTSVVLMNQEVSSSNATDLRGDYLIADGAAAWPTTGGTTIAPAGTYGTDGLLSAFVGEDLAGTWVLNVSDHAGQDLGSISAFGLNVTVPTPGALALLGMGGLILGRRRR
jgi:subtilisin-like proprotein convertase family protein